MTNPSDTAAARERLAAFAAEAEKTSQSLTEAYVAPYGPGGRMLLAADLRAILAENERLRDLLAQARVVCCAYGDWSPKGDDSCALRALLPAIDAALSNQQGGGE